jgi:signal transduction histidine kinase
VAEAANDKYLLGKAYNCLGNSYLDMKNPELALENYYKSIEYRRQLDNRLEVTYSLNNIALAYREMNLFSEAINSFKEAVSICQEIDDHINEAYMLIGIADVYERINDNNNALDYAIKAANIFIHYNDPIGLANTFSLIGSLHKNLNNIPLALEYYKRAHTIYTENNHEEGLSTSINHLGIVYDELGDYPRALGYFKQTLEIALANNDRVGVSTALNNIGYVNAKMKNYPEALSAYIKSVEISREMNDIPSEMNTYNNIAWVYFHSNDIIKAEYYATRAMALAPYINQLVFISESNEILSKIRYLQGRYKEAFDHKLKYMEIKDSLFNIDRNEKFMEMQVRFETTKKEKEIEILKKNDEINNLTIQRQRNFQMFWIALTFMLITLAAFIYNNLQSKKKINNLLSEKNDQLEDANKKLLESEENLKELNATKDRFFSIIAHDLKNPFNSLLGFSELLKNNFESYTKQETKEQIQIIHESANNLYKLLDNLLQWSRTQIGSIVYKPELFPLHPLVQQEIELLENFAEHKSIKIIIRVGSHLMVYADRNIIAIVIRNLINNAIKFSNVSGRILINAEEKDDMIEMAISDSGIGMEEAELKKLFRLDESFTSRGTADEEGTGLGLLLCKEFVEKNHGKIWATSTKGKGSTFYFTLHTHRWV